MEGGNGGEGCGDVVVWCSDACPVSWCRVLDSSGFTFSEGGGRLAAIVFWRATMLFVTG